MPPKKGTAGPAKKAAVASRPKAGSHKKPVEVTEKKSALPGPAASAEPEPHPASTTIGLKQINSLLFENPENEFRKSGKSALVIDPAERVIVFLRHRDVNALNVMNPADMETERIRIAVLGALRFGKPLALDLMTADVGEMWEIAVKKFDAVKPGLMDALLTGAVKTEQWIRSLVKEEDEPHYQWGFYADNLLENFSFILSTARPDVPPSVAKLFYSIIVE